MPVLDPSPRPLSVTVVGGFLGSGKTTLLSRIIRSAKGLRIGVLINDFGEVNIDADLVEEVLGDGVIRLTNGCICCSIRNDLTSALFKMMESHRLDHAIIETSGLSDPRTILEIFREMRRNIPECPVRLDGLVSLIDAEHFGQTLKEHPAIARAQVEAADLVLISKCDLAGPERTGLAEAKLLEITREARVLRVSHGDVPLEVVLGLDRVVEDSFEHEHDHDDPHDHDQAQPPSHGFTSWTFREDGPLSWKELAPVLTSLPSSVFRVKGFLNLAERSGDRILLHVVGRRVHVRTLGSWSGRTPRTELVVIGKDAEFPTAALELRFRGCVLQ